MKAGTLRGFCIAAGADSSVVGKVARAVEELGYSRIWTNDTPSGDGPATAAAMMQATTHLPVGVGAFAADRWPADRIMIRLEELGLDLARMTIVVGAGRATPPLTVVRDTVSELRERAAGRVRIGVAALGPQMCRLAGRIADVVLLNWTTPEKIIESRALVEEGAKQKREAASQTPLLASYVRLAIGPAAAAMVEKEASGYARLPHYRRHFESMGEVPGIAASGADEVPELLRPYDEVLDETILRAIPGEATEKNFLALAKAGAR